MDIEYRVRNSHRGENRASSLVSRLGLLGGEIYACDFSEIKVRHCTFFKMHIRNNSATCSRFENVLFSRCVIEENNLIKASFEDCVFEECHLSWNSFAQANWTRLEFKNCTFDSNGLMELNYDKLLLGYELRKVVDSKGNPMIYSPAEHRISHLVIAGKPELCVKDLWERDRRFPRKYVDELVEHIKKLSGIKLGRDH